MTNRVLKLTKTSHLTKSEKDRHNTWLVTSYVSNAEVELPVSKFKIKGRAFDVFTFTHRQGDYFDVGIDGGQGRISVYEKRGRSNENCSTDIVSEHLKACKSLEQKVEQMVRKVHPLMRPDSVEISQDIYRGSDWAVTVSEEQKKGVTIYQLTTKLRAPRYHLPEGFVFESGQFDELSIVSKAFIKGGKKYNISYCVAPNGRLIRGTTEREEYDLPLPDAHWSAIKSFLQKSRDHYFPDGDEGMFGWNDAQFATWNVLDLEYASQLSLVDFWDARDKGLTKSAEKIAKAILNSPCKDAIKGVVLYGSLARKDKLPGDIDLMLLVEPTNGILDPTKHYSLQDKKRPVKYNVTDVANGLVAELGIMPDLLTIGSKDEYYVSLGLHGEDVVENINFSEVGGGLNLAVLSTQFFNDGKYREKLMGLAFTPTYYRDVLTDGYAFNPTTGKFDISTKGVFGDVISSLEGTLEKARIEQWPNIGNDRPHKPVGPIGKI